RWPAVVSGAGQPGSTLSTNGWGAGATLRRGDTFTVAGTNTVNPLAYNSVGRLQQFTVTADVTESGGAMTIPISPPIITSGQLQSVDVSPASGSAVGVVHAL